MSEKNIASLQKRLAQARDIEARYAQRAAAEPENFALQLGHRSFQQEVSEGENLLARAQAEELASIRKRLLELLQQGKIEEFNRYRAEHPDERIDLREADLSRADLSDVNLIDANLSGANLSGANLIIAHLINADLSGANLIDATLIRANLRRANLINANLSRANLIDADLRRARFVDANLIEADFIGANLIDANLIGAYLHLANLSRADLSRANLNEANLNEANLRGANLREADLCNAEISYTVFADVDLRTVKGLESVRHLGPSEIGIHTIRLSEGHIPESFLRGCGVPDEFITYMASLTTQPIQYYSCFISYSHKDEDFAERLYNDLQGAGVRCWKATKDLKIGDRLLDVIDRAIRRHDKLLLVLSEQSIESDWVRDEVETAMEEERKRGETVLFPIRVDEAVVETSQPWAGKVRQRHIGDFSQWKSHDDYQRAFDRLLRDLKGADG